MSGEKCPGENVREEMSGRKCPGENVREKMSRRKCPGGKCPVEMSWGNCPGEMSGERECSGRRKCPRREISSGKYPGGNVRGRNIQGDMSWWEMYVTGGNIWGKCLGEMSGGGEELACYPTMYKHIIISVAGFERITIGLIAKHFTLSQHRNRHIQITIS